MVQRRKLAACLCLVLYVFSMSSFVVSALADNDYTTNTTFWHWLAGGTNRTIGNFLQSHIGTGNILGYFPATGVCARSSDNKHHAGSVTGVSDDGYCICVCEACGDEFKSSTLAQDVYKDCVQELPAKIVTDDGGVIWKPTVDDFYGGRTSFLFPSSGGTGISLDADNNFEREINFFCELKVSRLSDREFFVTYSTFPQGKAG